MSVNVLEDPTAPETEREHIRKFDAMRANVSLSFWSIRADPSLLAMDALVAGIMGSWVQMCRLPALRSDMVIDVCVLSVCKVCWM
jgi:hypothetical protein